MPDFKKSFWQRKKIFAKNAFLAILLVTAIGIICVLCLKLASAGMRYEWHWNRAWRSLGHFTSTGFTPGPILEGLGMTVFITLLGGSASIVGGGAICLLRLSPWPLCAWFAKIYVLLFRTVPLLIELFFIYFLIAPLLSLGPWGAAILSLGLFEAAYCAEIFRSAILSVPRTQWEAGIALGLGLRQCFWHIILPQAFKNAVPALTNQAIATLKDTSLVSAIAVADLTMKAQAIVSETFMVYEVWLIAGSIYLVLALIFSVIGAYIEKRQALPYSGV